MIEVTEKTLLLGNNLERKGSFVCKILKKTGLAMIVDKKIK